MRMQIANENPVITRKSEHVHYPSTGFFFFGGGGGGIIQCEYPFLYFVFAILVNNNPFRWNNTLKTVFCKKMPVSGEVLSLSRLQSEPQAVNSDTPNKSEFMIRSMSRKGLDDSPENLGSS